MARRNQHVFLGVDVGGTNIKCARVHNGRITARKSVATCAHRGFRASLQQIREVISPLSHGMAGIGIGIAGIIDSGRGIVRYSPNMPGWDVIHLARILSKEFNVPVSILNDVNAACLGEWRYGAARGCHEVFMLTVGTGVGGAAVCNGKLQFGAHGFAGEFGHIVIKEGGKKCACGNRGCLESYVGARPMVQLARKLIPNTRTNLRTCAKLTPQIIAQEAKRGDKVARDVVQRIGRYLGVGITSIIHLYDPEVVIVSGGISRTGRILFDAIRRTVKERVIGGKFRTYRIVPPALGDDAGILGAVHYARSAGHSKR